MHNCKPIFVHPCMSFHHIFVFFLDHHKGYIAFWTIQCSSDTVIARVIRKHACMFQASRISIFMHGRCWVGRIVWATSFHDFSSDFYSFYAIKVVFGHVIVWVSFSFVEGDPGWCGCLCLLHPAHFVRREYRPWLYFSASNFVPIVCKALCLVPCGVNRYIFLPSVILIPIGEGVMPEQCK